MTEGMAKVEIRANPRLALIRRYHSRFQRDVPPHDVGGGWLLELSESRGVAGQDLGKITSIPARRRALNHGVLDDLSPTGAKISSWHGA